MSLFDKVMKYTGVGKLFGLGAPSDMARQFEEQLNAQREAAKLQAASEATNVVKFDGDADALSIGTDTRRKKKSAGAYANDLGLQV